MVMSLFEKHFKDWLIFKTKTKTKTETMGIIYESYHDNIL